MASCNLSPHAAQSGIATSSESPHHPTFKQLPAANATLSGVRRQIASSNDVPNNSRQLDMVSGVATRWFEGGEHSCVHAAPL